MMKSSSSCTEQTSAVSIDRIGKSSFGDSHRKMLELQRQLATTDTEISESLLLFEPSPVVTLGSASEADVLLVDESTLLERGVEIEHVDRGGEATYHGPGQIIAYPVIRLSSTQRDLHRLLRGLEGAIIETLAAWDLHGIRVAGHTGVWIEDRKIASIGLSVRRWITGHGLALNHCGDLDRFQWIIPCGIRGCSMTSMEQELGTAPDRQQVETLLAAKILTFFEREAS